jgi:hypothetical protein
VCKLELRLGSEVSRTGWGGQIKDEIEEASDSFCGVKVWQAIVGELGAN